MVIVQGQALTRTGAEYVMSRSRHSCGVNLSLCHVRSALYSSSYGWQMADETAAVRDA